MSVDRWAAAVLLVHSGFLPTDTPGYSRCSGCMASVTWRAGGAAPHLNEHARALQAIADHQVAMLAAAGMLRGPEPRVWRDGDPEPDDVSCVVDRWGTVRAWNRISGWGTDQRGGPWSSLAFPVTEVRLPTTTVDPMSPTQGRAADVLAERDRTERPHPDGSSVG